MGQSSRTPAFYCLAGQTIWFNQGLPELQSFRLAGQPFPPPHIPEALSALAEAPPALQANGWLADHFSTVSLWWDEHGTLLEIPVAGRFWTAMDGCAICQVSEVPGSNPAFLVEALLGPPLVLALALRDAWCLHASAVEIEHKVIAFLGESGAGKSTLAAALAGLPGVRLVADDILPVVWENHRIFALPHFRQLKLPSDQQPGAAFPARLPLAAIYLLEQQPAISVEALGPGNSALVMAGHTVAARLFDRQLLSRHFAFCSQAAPDLPIRRLAYPRIRSELPLVWKTLQDDLTVLYA